MFGHFKKNKEVALPEINAMLRLLTHEPTGAQVLHIETDDDENSFCISFRTHPEKNDGVAHILEHTVLCGSKKFPVKDPFFLMNRRSLNTFMNAFTGGDFTCYPAATQNKEDFYNLLDVYLDAVFYPHLNRLSFLQEGHRLEFLNPEDPKTPLQFKGIVFNEMKGSYTSPERRLQESLNEKLFPTTTYGIDSGGKPHVIPSLTYQDLIDFHDKYYHPSNALFYLYGNFPLKEYLNFLEEKILSKTTYRPPLASLQPEKRFKAPLATTASFPIGKEEETEGKTRVALGWLTVKGDDQLTSLALTILLVALMDTDASPLKKGLLATKEVKQVSASIDTECAEVPIMFSFRGCNENDGETIEKATLDLMKEIVKMPIDRSLLESALHQITIHRTEISADELPWGLNLFMRAGLILQQGGDPEEALRIHSLFEKLRAKWQADPLYFNKLLQTWLIDNPHRVLLTMVPDSSLSEKEEEQEKRLLAEISKHLTQEKIDAIIRDAKELQALQQESEEKEECLPKISLSAIPKAVKDYPLHETHVKGLRLFHHDTFTNGMTYADLVLPIPAISQEEVPFLRLLISFLTQLGAGGKTYEETLHHIQATTGGISAALSLYTLAEDPNVCFPSLVLSGKALDQNNAFLFGLMKNFITSPDFGDERRLLELWEKHTTSLMTSLPSMAMRYMTHQASSSFSPALSLSQQVFGLDYLYQLSDSILPRLKKGLEKLSDAIFSQQGDLVITCCHEAYKKIHDQEAYGLYERGHKKDPYFIPKLDRKAPRMVGKTFASPVSYISQVVPSVPYTHEDAPCLSLASFVLDNQTLHTTVREQGGAYGVGSRQQNGNALFSFYSYRDPHIGETLEAFKTAPKFLVREKITENEREEAVLEMVQGLDAPITPGLRGGTAYTWLREGRTLEVRQKFRSRLLEATLHDLLNSVEKHLLPNLDKGSVAIAASSEMLLQENERRSKEKLSPLSIGPLDKPS